MREINTLQKKKKEKKKNLQNKNKIPKKPLPVNSIIRIILIFLVSGKNIFVRKIKVHYF